MLKSGHQSLYTMSATVNFTRIVPDKSVIPTAKDYFVARVKVSESTLAALNDCDRELLIFVDNCAESKHWLTPKFAQLLEEFIAAVSPVFKHIELFTFSDGVDMIPNRDVSRLTPGTADCANFLEPLFTAVSSQKLYLDMRDGKLNPVDAETDKPIDTSGIRRTKTTILAVVAGDTPKTSTDSGTLSALQEIRDRALLDIHVVGVGSRHPASLYDWYTRVGTTLGTYQSALVGFDVAGMAGVKDEDWVEFRNCFACVERVLRMCPIPYQYMVTGINLPMNLTVNSAGMGRAITTYNGLISGGQRLQESYQPDTHADRYAAAIGAKFILQNIEEFERAGADPTHILERVQKISKYSPSIVHFLSRLLKNAPKGTAQIRDYCSVSNAIVAELLIAL